jgi:hypothetical protein
METDFVFQWVVATAAMLVALASFMTSRRRHRRHAAYARACAGLAVVAVIGQLVTLAFEGIEDLNLPEVVLMGATVCCCFAAIWRSRLSKLAREKFLAERAALRAGHGRSAASASHQDIARAPGQPG